MAYLCAAPKNEQYPKKEPRLPPWWADLRHIVQTEMQNVMSRNGSTGGCSQGGGISYVSFVPKELVLPAKSSAQEKGTGDDRRSVTSVMYDQSINVDKSPGTNTSLSMIGQDPTTSTTTSYMKRSAIKEIAESDTTGRPSKRRRTSSPICHEDTSTSQVIFTVSDESQPFHGATFSKDVINYVFCTTAKIQYIAPVEKKFMCKVASSQDENSLTLWAEPWQRNGPEDFGVVACGIFIQSYERETRYNYSKDKTGPRIDTFLEFYVGDEFTTVEERTKADFEYLNRRALGITSTETPERSKT